jgi:hypothetical protein
MKIKVEREKIIEAVKKLDGIEIVLENPEDAKEAINLILRKTDLFKGDDYGKLRGINVSSFQEYKTSAVDYKRREHHDLPIVSRRFSYDWRACSSAYPHNLVEGGR